MQENWFINVLFNYSLSIAVRVKSIEDVEISIKDNKYKLLVVSGDNETIDLLLGLKIESEYLNITIEGKD